MNTATATSPTEPTPETVPPVVTPEAVETDAIGRAFDPSKFRYEDDGKTPKRDTMKRFIPLKAGRKNADGSPNKTATAAAPSFDDVEKAARAAVAERGETPIAAALVENATAETIIGAIQTALVIIGDEEGVLTDIEKEVVRRPLVRVLAKYEVSPDALPAEADLAVAIAAVFIARIQRPKTATFVAKVRLAIGNWWARRKGRELAAEVIEATK